MTCAAECWCGNSRWSESSLEFTEPFFRIRAGDHLARIIHEAQSIRENLLAGWKLSDPKMLAVLQSQMGWKEKVNWSHEELGGMIGQLAIHNQQRDQGAANVVGWRPTDAESVDRLEKLRKQFRSKINGPFTCGELSLLIGKTEHARGDFRILDRGFKDSEREKEDSQKENEELKDEIETRHGTIDWLETQQKETGKNTTEQSQMIEELNQKLNEAIATPGRERKEARTTLEGWKSAHAWRMAKQKREMDANAEVACGALKQEKNELNAKVKKMLMLQLQYTAEKAELEGERDGAVKAAEQSLKRKLATMLG